jgi:hypothetical protein
VQVGGIRQSHAKDAFDLAEGDPEGRDVLGLQEDKECVITRPGARGEHAIAASDGSERLPR